MYFPFEQLPPHARVWVYQANRSFSPAEADIISQALLDFCSQWSAHGNPLQTSFALTDSRFLILSVDERSAGASGCSIDGSVRVLKELGSQLNIDFFDRSHIAFLINGHVEAFPQRELTALLAAEELRASSITFNNLVTTKAEWAGQWKIPIENSWLAKYLPKKPLPA